jgi:hypothetical protein
MSDRGSPDPCTSSHSFQPPALVLLERIPAGDTTSPLTLVAAARLSGLVRLGRSRPPAQSATSCARRLVRSPAARHGVGGQRHARQMRSAWSRRPVILDGEKQRRQTAESAPAGRHHKVRCGAVRITSEKGILFCSTRRRAHRDRVTSKRETECGPPKSRQATPGPHPERNGI